MNTSADGARHDLISSIRGLNAGVAFHAKARRPRSRGTEAGDRAIDLSLLKTIFERIDGVGRLGPDRRQCPRTARSDVYRACPSQVKRGFAPHYISSRILQGFAEGGQH